MQTPAPEVPPVEDRHEHVEPAFQVRKTGKGKQKVQIDAGATSDFLRPLVTTPSDLDADGKPHGNDDNDAPHTTRTR